MSDLHVHGVARASARAAIAAAGARAIEHGDLAAVVTEAGAEKTRAAELMRRHWRVLEAVAGEATVLPVRFGTAMAGEQAVAEEFLAPQHDELVAELAALDGRVQFTVKGTYDEQALLRAIVDRSPRVKSLRERVRTLPDAAAHFERIQLGELVAAEVEQERERDAAWLSERLERLAVATSAEPVGGLDGAVNAAFLVERERAGEFREAVDAAAEHLGGRMQLRLLGPLPPYSFAGEQTVRAWA